MKIREILIVALLIVVVYLLQCRKPIVQEVKTEVRVTDTIFSSDTIIDYIYVQHHDLEPDEVIPHPIDTSVGMDLSDTSIFWRYWVYNVSDSLLEAKITAHSQTRPTIDFDYKIKNFTIRDTILIKDSVHTFDVPKSAMFFGVEVSGSQNRFGFSPSLTYSHKSGMNYSIRYDLINKEIGIGFSKKISFKK